MAETDAQRLSAIEDAIAKIRDGAQSLRIGNREITYADLEVLLQERRDILSDIAKEDGLNRRVCEF